MGSLQTKGMLWQNARDKKSRGRRENIKDILFLMVFLLCVLYSSFKATAVIAAIGIVLYFLNLFVVDSVFVWKYVPMFFSNAYYLLGVFFCDMMPVYLSELDATTHYTGAFQSLVLYNWFFFSFLRIIDYYVSMCITRRRVSVRAGGVNLTKLVNRYGGPLIFMLGLVMFLPIARRPAFAFGVTRFRYAKYYMPSILTKLTSVPTYLCPLVLCPLIQKYGMPMGKKLKKIAFIFIPYLAFLIWSGNKFGKLWTVFYSIAIPMVFAYSKNRIRGKDLMLPIGLGVVMICSVLGYHMMRGNSLSGAIEKLAWRTSAQGELWWGIFDLKKGIGLEIEKSLEEIKAIIESIITRGAVRHQGVYRLMEMLGDPKTVQNYLNLSVRYSSGGFELPYYYFSYFSFIILPLLICPLYALLTNRYISSILRGEFVSAIAALELLITFKSAAGQGDWYGFVSIESLFFIGLLVVTSLIHTAFYTYESSDGLKSHKPLDNRGL